MTGQHAKPTVYFGADHEKVRKYIDDAVAKAINEAAHAINAVREWCESAESVVGDEPLCCDACSARYDTRMELIAEVRALLPDSPSPTQSGPGGGDHMRDRDFPGGEDTGN